MDVECDSPRPSGATLLLTPGVDSGEPQPFTLSYIPPVVQAALDGTEGCADATPVTGAEAPSQTGGSTSVPEKLQLLESDFAKLKTEFEAGIGEITRILDRGGAISVSVQTALAEIEQLKLAQKDMWSRLVELPATLVDDLRREFAGTRPGGGAAPPMAAAASAPTVAPLGSLSSVGEAGAAVGGAGASADADHEGLAARHCQARRYRARGSTSSAVSTETGGSQGCDSAESNTDGAALASARPRSEECLGRRARRSSPLARGVVERLAELEEACQDLSSATGLTAQSVTSLNKRVFQLEQREKTRQERAGSSPLHSYRMEAVEEDATLSAWTPPASPRRGALGRTERASVKRSSTGSLSVTSLDWWDLSSQGTNEALCPDKLPEIKTSAQPTRATPSQSLPKAVRRCSDGSSSLCYSSLDEHCGAEECPEAGGSSCSAQFCAEDREDTSSEQLKVDGPIQVVCVRAAGRGPAAAGRAGDGCGEVPASVPPTRLRQGSAASPFSV